MRLFYAEFLSVQVARIGMKTDVVYTVVNLVSQSTTEKMICQSANLMFGCNVQWALGKLEGKSIDTRSTSCVSET